MSAAREASIAVNAKPVGMSGGSGGFDSSFTDDAFTHADTVFDVVALPAQTPLIVAARRADTQVITGATSACGRPPRR